MLRSFARSSQLFRLSRAASAESELILERLSGDDKGIAVISFNRPKAMNSFSKNMVKCMREAIDDVKFDAELRAVVVRSTSAKAFCTGADLKERAGMSPEEVGPFVATLRRMVRDFYDLPVPTIAAIDGFALGGGLEFALSADMRIASSSAKMGLTETKLAIIPGAGGTQTISRIIGVAKAKELIFTGRFVGSSEAERIGLVNRAVEQNEDSNAAYLAALDLAREIKPQVALRMAKMAINNGSELDLNSGLAIEQMCYAQVIPTQDRLEGLLAFKEKRKPVYKGH
ncbi:unnamed protein product [Oikopleura dioica]|uniref:Uncharacterized protein n=1 Tax=Oikopleura dioica TaxID=34765 RepID=E4Y7C3_OIKDI|nr:unnamed protein product [Oikopleura dioica]